MLRDTSKPRHILTGSYLEVVDAFLVSFPEFEYARALGDALHIVREVDKLVWDPLRTL